MSASAKREALLEQVKADRARLLEILREFSVELNLRKEELDEMIKRAKDDDDLPEDFHLGHRLYGNCSHQTHQGS
jgi:hypothetical protein